MNSSLTAREAVAKGTYSAIESPCVRILMIHIPKTGGSTLGKFFLKQSYIRTNCTVSVNVKLEEWNSIVAKDLKKPCQCRFISFYMHSPSIMAVKMSYLKWYTSLQNSNCTVLSLVVFREPHSQTMSAYYYFLRDHLKVKHRDKYKIPVPMPDFTFRLNRKYVLHNLQSQFLQSGYETVLRKENHGKKKVTRKSLSHIIKFLSSPRWTICTLEEISLCREKIIHLIPKNYLVGTLEHYNQGNYEKEENRTGHISYRLDEKLYSYMKVQAKLITR